MTPLSSLLDTRQVAALLRMTPDGVVKLVKRGRLVHAGRGSRGLYLFDPAAVAAYVTRGVAPAVQPIVDPWLDDPSGVYSAVYLLIYQDEIVYLGQSGDLHARFAWHETYKRYDRVRVLPLPDNRRTRSYVEKHIRDLVGETFYGNGESVRDRIEMRRQGPPVDVEALAGTGPIAGMVAFLRWGLG